MSSPETDAEKLFRLERLVPLCDSIRRGTEYTSALEQATAEVKKAATLPDRLEILEPAIAVLGGTSYLPKDDVSRELETVARAGRALQKCVDAETLKDARFDVKEAEQSVQRVETLITKAWFAAVQAEFSPLQRLGAILAGIPDTKAAGGDLQTWAAQVLMLSDSAPPSAESIQQLNMARAALAQRFDSLGQLGIDANVRNFLVAVAGKGATVANLTPEVLEWLNAKKAQSRFRIELL
jgi:hypothetical protein